MRGELDRSRRRRRLLWWSAPVVVLAVLAGVYLTALWSLTAWGVSRYDDDPAGAEEVFEALQPWHGPIEQWRVPFNAGTAKLVAGEAFAASQDLRAALAHVPEAPPVADGEAGQKEPDAPECRVRRNLSLAVEAIGDDAAESGDNDSAAAFWSDAQAIIAPCVTDEENEESSQRQQQKQEDAGEQGQPDDDDGGAEPDPDDPDGPEDGNDPDDGDPADPTPEPTPSEEPSADPKREELEQRNRDAERERQEQHERGGGGFGGGQNW